jgi:hypothetical protein
MLYDLTEPDEQDEQETPEDEEAELRSALDNAINDAVLFIDSEVSLDRAKAVQYYKGEKFGTEKEGRSQVITTEVRDTIHAVLPAILRVFLGSEKTVEYRPSREETVGAAEQATTFVKDVVLGQDNPGFPIFYSWFHDALLKKMGIVKSEWATKPGATREEEIVITSPDEMQALVADPSIESVAPTQNPDGSVTMRVTRKNTRGYVKVECIPPEELIFDRHTRSLDTAQFIGHRRDVTRSELVEMGVSEDQIDEAGQSPSGLSANEERASRNPYETADAPTPLDDAGDLFEYVEAYIRYDYDGDGIAELRRVCVLGPSRVIVHNEEVEEGQPFSLVCPHPIPHTVIGLSTADNVMDLQYIKSHLMRGMNDSLSLSIFPRIGYVDGRVSLADLLNDEIGAPIRMDAIGLAQPFVTPYVGKEALSAIEYLDRVKEQRIGLLPATIDSQALQSSTKTAVDASVTASQQQVEMICRVFAEGVKHLFTRIFKLLRKHQWYGRMVRINGTFTQVTPGGWDDETGVDVNVALGMGTVDQKLQLIGAIKQAQEQILQTLGPQNPLVSLHQYSNALLDGVTIAGRPDAARYFNRVDPNWQPPAPPPGSEQPNPEMELVKIESARVQAEMQLKMQESQLKVQEAQMKLADQQARLQLDEMRIKMEDDRERDRMYMDQALRAQELEMKYQQMIDQAALDARLEEIRIAAQRDAAIHANETRSDAQKHAAEVNAEAKKESQPASGGDQ